MSVQREAEESLWARGADGDGEAFGVLFDLHRDRLFRHAYRMLQNTHDAEDACAVAFLELWRRRAQVRSVGGSVLPWLIITVTNASRNLDRSRRRYRRLLDSLPHGDSQPSAEETALWGLAPDHELAAALAALSPADARLFALVALEDYAIVEAAPVLGLSPGAARTRMHRIRSRLQQRLGHTTLTGYISKEAT